jgi:MFS family permease
MKHSLPNMVEASTNQEPKLGVFWGWWIVAVSFLAIFMFFGARHSFGVFLLPMCQDMGWSRGELSFIFMAMMILYGVASIVWGRLADQYSPRTTVSIAAIIGFIGYGLTAFVQTKWHILMTYSLLFGIGMAGSYAPTTITVRRWFHRQAGLAMGITVAAVGVGGFVFAPAAKGLIDTLGWRLTYLIIGALGLVTVPLLSFLVLRREPKEMGLLPDGAIEAIGKAAGITTAPVKAEGYQTVLRRGSFWALSLSYSFVAGGTYTLTTHIVAFAQDIGMSAHTGSLALGIIGLSSVSGRLIMGGYSDRIGRRKALLLALGIEFLASLLLFIIRDASMLFLFSVILGFGYGSFVPLYPAFLGDLFGGRDLAFLFGISTLLSGLSTGAGAFVAGTIFDYFGNYFWAFVMVSISFILAAILAYVIKTKST